MSHFDIPYGLNGIKVVLRAGVLAITELVMLIDAFRGAKDYRQADLLRDRLISWGLELRQGDGGATEWFVADPHPEATRRFNSWLESQLAETRRRDNKPFLRTEREEFLKMSDTIPRFQINDRVRIMMTDEMVAAGAANLHGLVVEIQDDPDVGQICGLMLDRIPAHDTFRVSSCHLIRE